MSVYHKVYSPEGQMFEVPYHKFQELVLQKGWTQTKPEAAPAPTPVKEKPKETKKTSRKSRTKVEEPVFEEPVIVESFESESED